jgi:restriction system protein
MWGLLIIGLLAAVMLVFAVARSTKPRSDAEVRVPVVRRLAEEDSDHDAVVELATLTGQVKIEKLLKQHLDTLVRRRAATRRVDHYGVVDETPWQRELDYFVAHVVIPTFSQGERYVYDRKITQLIGDRVAQAEAAASWDVRDLSPEDFETWCAKELERSGWTTRLTARGADQGADVLATWDHFVVALQCKFYSSPVGNKAVQEAYASARHYGAEHAAVVTNAGFTKSARELAASTGVLLLAHTELGLLRSRLDARKSP